MQSNGQAGNMEDVAEMGMDFAQVAYRLKPILKMTGTPEDARNLSDNAFCGIRIVIDEVIETLWSAEGSAEFIVDQAGYKLSMLAALLDTVERASELAHDVWSGIRIMLEEITEFLLNFEPAALKA
ncbi:MAG: hypothetical protein HIU83_15790 [Proteobacteria bacterium]|nr:hypothetical protein [Pseudomonadota bacterium]